jgi:hypothetical protein
VRTGDITAVLARDALTGGRLIYNPRTNLGAVNPAGPINDPTAILLFKTSDLNTNGTLKSGVPVEPLVLRAAAGDCIKLTLRNRLDDPMPDLDGFSAMPMIIPNFNNNQVNPSRRIGLHAQLLHYDISVSDGATIGFNPSQTTNVPGVGTPTSLTYTYYAGNVSLNSSGALVATPIEFGAINLIPSDPIKHSSKGALAALVIEPRFSTWVADAAHPTSATVTLSNGTTFREHVLFFQNDINFRFGNGTAIPVTAESEDPEDSGHSAFNYKSEPMWARLGFAPDTPLTITRTFDFTNAVNNVQVGGDPVTPIFTATRGTPVRFRLVQPGGHARNNVFVLHGHAWQVEPWTNNSTVIGNNPLSEVKGAEMGFGAGYHFNAVPLNGAGGKFRVTGDYLFRTFKSFGFDNGMWGIFRVTL